MRGFVKVLMIGSIVALMFSGCAENGRVDARMLTKNNHIQGMRAVHAFTPAPNLRGYEGYKNSDNAEYKCSAELTVHAIAIKALENGYPYFSLVFPEGSNKKPLSVNETERLTRYCASNYYDKESNLLDDKCKHIGFGNSTPSRIGIVEAYFFKSRNPFIPFWDARKTAAETKDRLMKTCLNDNKALYDEIVSGFNEFSNVDMD